jgi:hypothetical protein
MRALDQPLANPWPTLDQPLANPCLSSPDLVRPERQPTRARDWGSAVRRIVPIGPEVFPRVFRGTRTSGAALRAMRVRACRVPVGVRLPTSAASSAPISTDPLSADIPKSGSGIRTYNAAAVSRVAAYSLGRQRPLGSEMAGERSSPRAPRATGRNEKLRPQTS